MDQNDIESLALCSWKEARGEGAIGCEAVMHVIVNRVGFPGFAKNIHDVIYGKNQFTSMSVPSDPEFNLIPAQDDDIFLECQQMAASVGKDVTNGAHYYANLAEVTSGWFKEHIVDSPDHPVTAVLGRHTFYK